VKPFVAKEEPMAQINNKRKQPKVSEETEESVDVPADQKKEKKRKSKDRKEKKGDDLALVLDAISATKKKSKKHKRSEA
jgi:hypothetical protein